MTHTQQREGLAYGIAAFVLWGIAPIYFKQVADASAWQILAHRVLWSCLFVILAMFALRIRLDIRRILNQRKLIFYLCLSTLLIAFNWLLFTWAVINDHIMETSLGYFINPLVNVLLGFLIFRDRLSTAKYFALALAIIGVAYQIWVLGSVPIIALGLAFSFAFYGLIRKLLPVDALNGLLVETLLLLPFACLYLLFPVFDNNSADTFNYWLLLAGAVTTIPLAFFASATSRLTLSTIGFLQFIAPSLSFLIAIFIYQEEATRPKLVTFACIWLGLIVYSADSFISAKKQRMLATENQ